MRNQDPDPQESLWRRQLSEAERAALRDRPELELEARLTDALAKISNTPMPSNFTARVLDAIALEEARAARETPAKGWRWNWRGLLPRVGVTAAVLLLAGIGLQQHEHHVQMARSLAEVASTQNVPSVEALNNFDVIQHMSQSGRADTDLLAALQ